MTKTVDPNAVGELTPTVQPPTVGGVQRSLPTATFADPMDPHGSGVCPTKTPPVVAIK
jgi:hypothetical protein